MTNGRTTHRRAAFTTGVFLVAVAAALAVMMASGRAFDPGDYLLPDLVSDWGAYDELGTGTYDDARVMAPEEISWPPGSGNRMLVVQFDGFVTNIGDGPLRIQGNPQTDSVYQWLLTAGGDIGDPSDYDPINKVTVVYETDDGHNHFHLESAMEYSLWTEDRSEQVTVGAKVGFCLYDIDRITSAGPERSYYNGSRVDFCDQYDPDSTDVEMGISPGWRDVYGWSISQQWVDVSDVAPGRYHLAATTDTGGQIIEADEDNNGVAFHPEPVTIEGHRPTDLTIEFEPDTPIDFSLPSTSFGNPAPPVFTVVTPPEHGEVEIDPVTGTATYSPDPGHRGADAFEYSIDDPTTPYPRNAPIGVIELTAASPELVPSSPSDGPFSDVAAGHIFAAEISWLSSQGITAGCGTGLFCPDEPVTRAQMASFLTRALDLAPSDDDVFSDDDRSVHQSAIQALAASGITTGCRTGAFCPERPLTRAEMASFLTRAFGLPSSDVDAFADDDDSIHQSAIQALAASGITTGCRTGAYCPNEPVTRGQMAAFLFRSPLG